MEGQNVVVEHLSTEGQSERLPALANQLVRWKPDVIVAPSTPNALAARKATQTIPIVAATLFEGSGLIASLARPGGNVTGITLFAVRRVCRSTCGDRICHQAGSQWPPTLGPRLHAEAFDAHSLTRIVDIGSFPGGDRGPRAPCGPLSQETGADRSGHGSSPASRIIVYVVNPPERFLASRPRCMSKRWAK